MSLRSSCPLKTSNRLNKGRRALVALAQAAIFSLALAFESLTTSHSITDKVASARAAETDFTGQTLAAADDR